MTDRKPTIGITMGDYAGIGPEVVVKALAHRDVRDSARFVIYGINTTLTLEAERLGIEPFWFRVGADTDRATRTIDEPVVVVDYDRFDGSPSSGRKSSRAGGLSSKIFVEDAIADAAREHGEPRAIDGIVTAPISKESWNLAGFKWPGHTELLATRFKSKRNAMMFVSPRLRVILATAHIPLMQIRNVLSIGCVYEPIELGHEACRQLGIERPKIAVCGLNPHAGEGGIFGDEETRVITPAIELAERNGIRVTGPHPADTVFIGAAAGDHDLVVAMYHDQGLIPVKLLGWDKAVNWTVGLPAIRTSPDHGTAFDIAGRGKASEGSMVEAIRLACQLATQKLNPLSSTAYEPAHDQRQR